MSSPWQCLEDLPGLLAVPAGWRMRAGKHFEGMHKAFLRTTTRHAHSFQCPRECGCAHEIVRHGNGRVVAVCRCESWNCDDIILSVADTVLVELNWPKFGRAIANAFGCDAKDAGASCTSLFAGTRQVAAFGGAGLPVVLTIQRDRGSFAGVVTHLVAALKERFILLAPTSRHMDANTHALLNGAKAGFFDLESHLTLMPSGLLHAPKSGGELFSALLPPVIEELTMEVARKLYALVLACHTEQVLREAPIKSVFDLYCKMGFSAEETAIKLKCSKATIINRLKLLRQRTGVSADKLRDYKPFFEEIETSLADPRARRIRRKDAMHGDDPDEDHGRE